MRLRALLNNALILLAGSLLAGCSASRHVPQGSYLLDRADVVIQSDKATATNAPLDHKELTNFLRQHPNHKVLGFARLSLGVYNLSGRDSTRWYNRWIRKIGQPPVIYDPVLTDISAAQLRLAMVNRGYNDATVTVDSILDPRSRKARITYRIHPGAPLVVDTVIYRFDDPSIAPIVLADSALFPIRRGALLDRDILEAQRAGITSRLRDRGYFDFNKEQITYLADTVSGSRDVTLTMHLHSPRRPGQTVSPDTGPENSEHTKSYTIARVIWHLEPGLHLSPALLDEKCFIRPGDPYSLTAVNRTYEALSQLGIVKYVNITFQPFAQTVSPDTGSERSERSKSSENSENSERPGLDAIITLSPNRRQNFSVELQGTHAEGDLGFGLALAYQHRNLAHGAEILSAKFRTAYESLSGDFEGLINNRYSEYAGEVGITFPKFEAPFLSRAFKQRVRANTEFTLSLNYQERPEYTRLIAGVAWKYRWNDRFLTNRHVFDLIDLNLVYLPRSTIDFINTVAPTNPLLRYSYEDHLIMRLGYTFYHTNRRQQSAAPLRVGAPSLQSDVYAFRASAETAGNLLYAISSIVGQQRSDGAYKIFGVQYAQYVKAEADYSLVHHFNPRNSLAFHAGLGIGVPYGNSSMIPFEKRFYAGGANSVRGWGVRTLGPGAYDARNSVTDFINQCGDISLALSLEYRARLFWVVEGALFVDAGNIWTIRDYPNQPGGVFRFDSFYKQIAAAYGAGIRLDFTYFLLRFDLGMRAHNPAADQEPWPLIHPDWSRDHTFHLSIGYPF